MKNQIKAVIFDMGGVLLKTVDSGPRKAMAARFGVTREELEKFVFHGPTSHQSEVGEVSDIFHWETVLAHFNQPEEDSAKAYTEYFSGDAIDAELMEFILSLKSNWRLGLLSNAWVDARNKLGKLYDFIEIFDVSIFSAEVKLRKPDEKIYKLILEKLDVQPWESLFIDDFLENIESAKGLGINTIHYKNTEKTIEKIKYMLESQ